MSILLIPPFVITRPYWWKSDDLLTAENTALIIIYNPNSKISLDIV